MIIEDFKRNDAVIRRERMAGNEGEEKGKKIKEKNKRETGEKEQQQQSGSRGERAATFHYVKH